MFGKGKILNHLAKSKFCLLLLRRHNAGIKTKTLFTNY